MISKRNKKRIARSVICGYVVLLAGCKGDYYSPDFPVVDKTGNNIAVENNNTFDQRVIEMSETFNDSAIYNHIVVGDELVVSRLHKKTPVVVKHGQDCSIRWVNDKLTKDIVREAQKAKEATIKQAKQRSEIEQVQQYMQSKRKVH